MAKKQPKVRNKKYRPPAKSEHINTGTEYTETTFLFTEEDNRILSTGIYIRAIYFLSGQGSVADRTILMIRLYAGQKMLDWYDVENGASVFSRALDAMYQSLDEATMSINPLSEEDCVVINSALDMTCDLMNEAALPYCIQAIKHGEDQFVTDARSFEYHVVKEPA